MTCDGCGNQAAVVTRTYWYEGKRVEECNDKNCGNIPIPWSPDVYFRKPEFVENLGDKDNPYGQVVESKRHKARIMHNQGIREDGDFYHGSRDKGIRERKFKLRPEFEKKLDENIRKAVRKSNRRP